MNWRCNTRNRNSVRHFRRENAGVGYRASIHQASNRNCHCPIHTMVRQMSNLTVVAARCNESDSGFLYKSAYTFAYYEIQSMAPPSD